MHGVGNSGIRRDMGAECESARFATEIGQFSTSYKYLRQYPTKLDRLTAAAALDAVVAMVLE